MTLADRLQKLVEHGCIVDVRGDVLPVAWAHVLDKHAGVLWCRMFPGDQSDVHLTRFARFEVLHERDVALVLESGVYAAYFGPYEEWPEHRKLFEQERKNWEAYLAEPKNRTAFERFVGNEREAYDGG